jgi:ABC-type arginine transport system ATPase subunit
MSTSPYPGLRPFHRDEADIFFGRDEQVDQLLIRLGKSRFLAVVGPSGCGKSSLVHTGLLNALDAGLLAGAGLHWRIATMQPGSHPMQNLATALVENIGMNSNPHHANETSLPDSPNPSPAKGEDTPQNHHTALLLASLRGRYRIRNINPVKDFV